MANNFTFQTSLRLNSAGFKKGIKEVKGALNDLKSSFLSLAGALGAGLGFSQFISSMKDTAVQLSVAQNVLKNVSKVTKEYTDGVSKGSIEISNYAENLQYVRRLAKDYSQDLIGLTENFAKFHAACDKTNLSLEQQKDVFEALTRAAAYYHMSADQTNDMTLAITQMMSKGKVTSEELRRQLGNALPGAFNLMAAAIGVSTAELEDMMSAGKVISSEVLPRFAAMLNTVTKNADFDSLQMSMNRLKNTWTEFVERSGAENIFQGIVERANQALGTITKNINEISSLIKGLLAGIGSYSVFKYLQKQGNEFYEAQEKRIKEVRKEMAKARGEIIKLSQAGKVKFASDSTFAEPVQRVRLTEEEIAALRKHNALELEALKISVERTKESLRRRGITDFTGHDRFYNTQSAKYKEIENLINKIPGVQKQTNSFFNTVGAGIRNIGVQIGNIIKSMGISALIGLVIGGLTTMITHLKKIKEEWKKIHSIVEDYHNEVQKTDDSLVANEKVLRNNLAILQDTSNSERVRLNALNELNKQMGTSYNKEALDATKQAYKDIVEEVNRWIEATKKQAQIQIHARKAAEAQSQIEERSARLKANKTELDSFKWYDENGTEYQGPAPGDPLAYYKFKKLKREVDMDTEAIKNLQQVADEADAALKKLGVELFDLLTPPNVGPGGGEQSDIGKVLDKYTENLKELDNKLKEHAITQEEYNEEFDDLVSKFWKEAAATGKLSIDDIFKKIEKGQVLTKLESWYKDLYENARKAAVNNTARASAKAIEDSIDDAIADADKKLDDEFNKWSEKLDKNTQANIESLLTGKPQRKNRDNTFDYNKTKGTIKEEEFSVSSDYIKDLEDAINTITSKYDKMEDAAEAVRAKLAQWKNELSIAKKEAATLEDAMKIAKIQEDIDELNKSINEAIFGGIKNLASSMDRVIKGIDNIRDVFNDSDSTGWEQFMAIFNELVQIIETIASAYQTVENIQAATNKLNEAEIALSATKISLLERELVLRQALAAQKRAEAKATEGIIAADIAEAATSQATTSAKAGEAVAGATASGSKLPFPFNLMAIAAGVAAVIAALASIKKFASGGIVGGNSYSGDKQLARVNSGELILNRGQQRHLWDMLNGKSNNGGGQVEFVIHGKDLVGTLNNYNKIKRG